MASRDWLKHSTGPSAPSDATLGDEWFNTSTNRLLKRVAVSGTTVDWRELSGGVGVQQNGVTISANAPTINFANASVVLDGTSGAVRITATASPGGLNTHVQFNNNGVLDGSSNLTWNGSNLGINGSLTTTQPVNIATGTSGTIATFGASGGRVLIQGGAANNAIFTEGTSTFGIHPSALFNSGILVQSDGGVRIMNLTSGRVTFATTNGQLTDSSSLTWNGTTLGVTGFVTANRANLTGGINSTSWSGATGIGFNTAGTNTDTSNAGGTISSRVNYSFNSATMAANVATTVTNAINLFVDVPLAGANTTLGTPWSLWSSGNTRVAGILFCDTTIQQNAGFQFLSTSTAVSTAGSVQGDATLITTTVNNVTTVGATTQGVRLPVISTAGVRVLIRNATSTAFNVYPGSGAQINLLGTNTAFPMPATQNATIEFVAVTTTQWSTLAATYA